MCQEPTLASDTQASVPLAIVTNTQNLLPFFPYPFAGFLPEDNQIEAYLW